MRLAEQAVRRFFDVEGSIQATVLAAWLVVSSPLLGVAPAIYVPLAMTWSAERYGLIGIAFALQSWLLVLAFLVVAGAVVGATVVERTGSSHSAPAAR